MNSIIKKYDLTVVSISKRKIRYIDAADDLVFYVTPKCLMLHLYSKMEIHIPVDHADDVPAMIEHLIEHLIEHIRSYNSFNDPAVYINQPVDTWLLKFLKYIGADHATF